MILLKLKSDNITHLLKAYRSTWNEKSVLNLDFLRPICSGPLHHLWYRTHPLLGNTSFAPADLASLCSSCRSNVLTFQGLSACSSLCLEHSAQMLVVLPSLFALLKSVLIRDTIPDFLVKNSVSLPPSHYTLSPYQLYFYFCSIFCICCLFFFPFRI